MSRLPAIDLVRTIGIIAIVAGHVWSGPHVDTALYTWHVPIFFFLTGYLWTPGRPFRDEVLRRSRSLLKPYVFWLALIYVIFLSARYAQGTLTLGTALRPLYGGSFATLPFSTFWFVGTLWAAAVLWRLIEQQSRIARLSILSLAVVSGPTLGPWLAKTPFAIGSALPILIFIAAGQFASAVSHSRRSRTLVMLAACVAVAFIVLGVSKPLDLKYGLWGTPVLSAASAIALSWAIVIACQIIGHFAPRWLQVAVTRFALAGFTVVLVHPLILWVVRGLLPPVILFSLAVLIPLTVGVVGRRTRVRQWMTGVATPKP